MKRKSAILCISVFIVIIGCESSNIRNDYIIPIKDISLITQGETTKNELLFKFGKPYKNFSVSETDEIWMYKYILDRHALDSYFNQTGTHSKKTVKILSILFKNGKVFNYNY